MSNEPIAPLSASQHLWDCPSSEWSVDIKSFPVADEMECDDRTFEAKLKVAVERQIERSLTQHHEVLLSEMLSQIRSLMVLTRKSDRQEMEMWCPKIMKQTNHRAENGQEPCNAIPTCALPVVVETEQSVQENHHVERMVRKASDQSLRNKKSSPSLSSLSKLFGSRSKCDLTGHPSEQQGTFHQLMKKSISSIVDVVEKGQQSRQEQMVDFVKGVRRNSRQSNQSHSSGFSLGHPSLAQQAEEDFIAHTIPKNKLHSFLLSPLFNVAMGFLVCSNAILIGCEVNYLATHPDKASVPMSFQIISYGYTCIFIIELVLRLVSDGSGFLCVADMKDLMWNYLDIFIVLSSVVEIGLDFAARWNNAGENGGLSMSNVSTIRIIRIFRLLRVIRMARFVRFIRSLRMMVYSILCTLMHVFWAMVLLAAIMYVFAILFTSAATSYRASQLIDENLQLIPDLEERWGSMGSSMLSLFMSIAAGISWVEVIEPLNRLDTTWTYLFLSYLSFTYFAVLNVVTGVFCQAAVQSSNEDQEAMLQTFLRHKRIYTERFIELFKNIDADHTGTITLDEYQDQMYDEDVRNYFASLGLESADALCIFDLFEEAGADGIRIEEFVMGCLRMKGFARSSDMLKLMHEHRLLSEQMEKLIGHFNLTHTKRAVSHGMLKKELLVQTYADDIKKIDSKEDGQRGYFNSMLQRTKSTVSQISDLRSTQCDRRHST